MKTHTTSGIQVTEYDEPDTEDITLTDPATDPWERLADVYADGQHCPGCMWHESGWNPYTQRRWRECHAMAPAACPVVNPKSIANAMKRQAA
jgi:hypothetical protein